MSAISDILDERGRQVAVEGWSHEHDDAHADGELMDAAMCYFLRNKEGFAPSLRDDGCPFGWPWHPMWWKPKDPRRDLVRAGALMIAEIDRLTRKGLSFAHVEHKLALVVTAIESLDGVTAET